MSATATSSRVAASGITPIAAALPAAAPALESVLGFSTPARFKERLVSRAIGPVFDAASSVLRRVWPIPHARGTTAVLRHADVIEVFGNAAAFPVDYAAKLAVIMGQGHEFLLGMGDTAAYRRDIDVLRRVMRPGDAPALARQAEALAEAAVVAGAGRAEVVQMVRDVTFGVLCPYLGVTAPAGADLQAWATRLFQFQFADPGNDPALRAKVDRIAPAFRSHIDGLIADRKRGRPGSPGGDDVLGRLLALQQAGVPGTDDASICTALLGMVVGGPPQPPMVVPQALEQLLRRPGSLAQAQAAARTGDDATLAALVMEAMRFDPLAPGMFRRAAIDTTIAEGRWYATRVRAGTTVFVAFRSAMNDSRAVPNPGRFDASRPTDQYIHFGHGHHTCFGIHLNRALLPAMLKPLLARPGLRRANGRDGRLAKRGDFADRLVVLHD